MHILYACILCSIEIIDIFKIKEAIFSLILFGRLDVIAW